MTTLLLAVPCFGSSPAQVTFVERPSTDSQSVNYKGNCAPSALAPFLKLPFGSVKPGGRIEEIFGRQVDGLTGHLGRISIWLSKKDNVRPGISAFPVIR